MGRSCREGPTILARRHEGGFPDMTGLSAGLKIVDRLPASRPRSTSVTDVSALCAGYLRSVVPPPRSQRSVCVTVTTAYTAGSTVWSAGPGPVHRVHGVSLGVTLLGEGFRGAGGEPDGQILAEEHVPDGAGPGRSSRHRVHRCSTAPGHHGRRARRSTAAGPGTVSQPAPPGPGADRGPPPPDSAATRASSAMSGGGTVRDGSGSPVAKKNRSSALNVDRARNRASTTADGRHTSVVRSCPDDADVPLDVRRGASTRERRWLVRVTGR